MNLTRWEPFKELEEMSARLNRLLGAPVTRQWPEDGALALADWAPAVDVQETDGEYLVKADLPAVKKDDVHVEIQDGMLCVTGERKQEKEEKGTRFHRVERAYGKFERRVALPADVDAAKVAAEFKEGVLQVHLPKSAAARPRSVAVTVS